MAEYKGFDIFDIFMFVMKRKKNLSILFLSSMAISYLGIYFLIEEQYESTATIIPAEDASSAGLGSMLKGLKNLPLNLTGSSSVQSEINRYNTIIFSRTTIEDIIKEFDLYKVYNIDTASKDFREQTLKRLRREIVTKETDEDAFEIIVSSNTPQRAADMVNYLIKILNDKIVQLKISKSRENRIFLEKRVAEIYQELRSSEDTLRKYQELSGLIDFKSQIPEVLSVYGTLESELMTKKLKKNVLENLYDKQSSEVKSLEIEINEYEKKLSSLRNHRESGSVVLAMKSLPNTAVEFYRRFRQVEINSALLEFIVPLFEQAKIEEKKDYPILQVIDYGVPPAKKSWPPRTLLALLGALFITSGNLVYVFIRSLIRESVNPKVVSIRQELSTFIRFRKK